MSQSNPQLPLPAAPETQAFRAFETVLKDDPTLSPIVRTWVTWTGSNDDLLEPTFSNCPYIRLSPFPAGSDWVTEGQHSSPLVIRIQAAVSGSRADNLLNFWARFAGHSFRSPAWRRRKPSGPDYRRLGF